MIVEVSSKAAVGQKTKTNKSVFDHGGTRHLSNYRDTFLEFVREHGKLKVESSELAPLKSQMSVKKMATMSEKNHTNTLQKVRCEPGTTCYLIFASKPKQNSSTVTCDQDSDSMSGQVQFLQRGR